MSTKRTFTWLAAVLIGSVSAAIPVVSFGQPASPPAQLPVNPIDQAHAWEMPGIDPAIAPPGQQPTAPITPQPTAEQRATMEQQQLQNSVVVSQFVQAQVLAQIQAQAQQNQAVQPAEENDTEEPAAPEPTQTPVVQEPVQPAAISLDAPTAVDARGANAGASLTWQLPAAGHANRYALYCDDGTLASASTPRVVLASDECPSTVAFTSGARPDRAWRACAEVAGTDVTASLTGLANGEPMAFALAAIDDSGNVGPLSNVSCAIPSASGEYELDDPTSNTAAAETGEGCSASSTGVSGALTPLALGAIVGIVGLAARKRGRRS